MLKQTAVYPEVLIYIAHKATGFLNGETAFTILVSTLALAVVAELSSWISSRALGSGLAWLRLFQPTLGGACLALFGGLYLSLGAPHGGFRAIEPPDQAVVTRRIDLDIIAVEEGLANGRPTVIGLVENHGRATAWSPTIGDDGRVLLSAIEPGQSAPFIADSASGLEPAASADPPNGARPSTGLRAIQVTLHPDESRGGTVVAGRILNTSSAPLRGVRVIVVAHDDAGSMAGLAETSAEVEQDRLAPNVAEPFRVHFPTGVAVSSVTVFGEGTETQ